MNKHTASYKIFVFQSALLWAGLPILWSFMPAFMQTHGFSVSQIGMLMAINPLIAISVQPFIGMRVDRSKSKNRIFILLMSGTLISVFLFPLNPVFSYILIMVSVLSFFQAGLIPISESIAIESVVHMGKSYAPVRMAGTIGYSITAIGIGYLMKLNTNTVFLSTIIIGGLNMLMVWRMPNVEGHPHIGKKVSIKVILEDKLLLLYNGFSIIAQLLLSFYMTFLPIFFLDLGGSQNQLGIVYFIAAMSEIPFLLGADRLLKKFGNQKLLILSMFVIGFRIFLLIFVKTPSWIYLISALNGLTFIVFSYTLAVYVNNTVKKELKTTGQTVLALSMGIGRILGAILGGFLIDGIGTHPTMILSFVLCIVAIVLFILGYRKLKADTAQKKINQAT